MNRLFNLSSIKDNYKSVLMILLLVTLSSLLINSFIKPSYVASAIVSPAEEDSSLGSILGGGIGGSLVGNLLSSDSTSVQIALATLESRNFLYDFVMDNSLLPELEVKNTPWDAHKAMLKRVKAEKITGSQLYLFSLQWENPEKSAELLNEMIASLNEYLKIGELTKLDKEIISYEESIKVVKNQKELSMLYSLLERAIGRKVYIESDDEYVFRTIDPAQPPRSPWWPNYLLLSLLILTLWGILSMFYLKIISRK